MNPAKRGLSTGGKAGVAVIVVVVAVALVYFLPGLYKGGGSTGTQSGVSTVSGTESSGLYSLVKAFSQMQLVVDTNDPNNGPLNNTYAYSVLGAGKINSTTYTRVEYTTKGVSNDVVMWFNSTGGLGRVDVPGLRNYTGNGVINLPYVTNYVNIFGVLPTVTTNATLFALLSRSFAGTESFGPTQADVTTYNLAGTSGTFSSLTVKVATVPANDVQLAVYVNAKLRGTGGTELIQVTSMKVA